MNVLKGGSDPPSQVSSIDDSMEDENYQDVLNVFSSSEVNINSSIVQDNNSISVNEKVKEKVWPKILYDYKSPGPFEVFVESKEKNIGHYHNLALAKIIYESNFKGLKQINKKGKNRIGVVLSSYIEANEFLEHFSKTQNLNVFIPSHKVTCKGIIRNVDLDIDIEKNVEIIKAKNNKVLESRRFNRKINNAEGKAEYAPTGTICLTFSGTVIPKEVSIFGLMFRVAPYVAPVVQCYNCLQFGHTRKLCRAKSRCIGCGQFSHDENRICNLKCFHCDNVEHNSLSKQCPEHKRQVVIKEIMAFENKTFFEASELVPLLPNKSRRNKLNSYTSLRKEDFPQVGQPSSSSDNINIKERREAYQQVNPRPSYSSALVSSKKRRTEETNNTSFDWHEHNQLLISPNGRCPQSSDPSRNIYMHTSKDSLKGLDEVYSPNQREDLSKQVFNDIIKTVATLPLQERLELLNCMTQLFTSNANPSNQYSDVSPAFM